MRQKTFNQTNQPSYSTLFYLPSLAVAIDLIFFKVKNMYHTPALAAIFAAGSTWGLSERQNNLEQLPVWVSLCPSSSLPLGTLF